MQKEFVFYIQSIIASFYLWFGLFIITQDHPLENEETPWWTRPSVIAGINIALYSFTLLGTTIQTQIHNEADFLFWGKLTWWAAPISSGGWFIAIINYVFDNQKQERRHKNLKTFALISISLYSLYATFMGTFTNKVLKFDQISKAQKTAIENFFIPPGEFSFLYSGFILIVLWGSAILLLHKLKEENNTGGILACKTMFVGNMISAVGATLNVISYFKLQLSIPQQLGGLMMAIGLIIFGKGILTLNEYKNNRLLKINLVRSLSETIFFCLLYLVLLDIFEKLIGIQYPHHSLRTTVIYTTTLIHAPLQPGQAFIDRFIPTAFLPDWEQKYLKQLSKIKTNIVTAKTPQAALTIAESDFAEILQNAREGELYDKIEKQINLIFRHKSFENDEVLSNSDLNKLNIIQAITKPTLSSNDIMHQQAELLRNFLKDEIQKMCPNPGEEPPFNPSKDWIEYTILYRKYLLGENQTDVEEYFANLGEVITGGAYSRSLKNARKRLAAQIWQLEIQYLSKTEKLG